MEIKPLIIKFIQALFDQDEVDSQILTDCLEKIQVQRKDLVLDLVVKHKSITSHSCPATVKYMD